MILGHEDCAEVVEVGSEVKDFKDGLDAEFFHVNDAEVACSNHVASTQKG